MDLKKYIRSIPDYPKKGILFRDITTLIKDENAFKSCIDQIVELSKKINFDKIAAIESRGFIFSTPISYILNKPVILLRKKNKLPAESIMTRDQPNTEALLPSLLYYSVFLIILYFANDLIFGIK